MSIVEPDLIAFSDQLVPQEALQLNGMLPPRNAGPITALFADLPGEERSDLILKAMNLCPRIVPIAPAGLRNEDLESLLSVQARSIVEEIDRLAGRREVIVTLSYPVPVAGHAREGSGIRWLKQRAEHLRQLSVIRRRAVDSLEALSDAVSGLAEAHCTAPFGSSRKSRIGADLALLVPSNLVHYLSGQLAESAPRLLPSGSDARCTLSGPLPAFSFAASLSSFADETDGLRAAS